MSPGVMQGIRILEVCDHTFVPAATAILADWGADVIKIEHATKGDAARGLASSGTVDLGGQVHAILEHANRGKRSLGLDLKNPDGLAVLYELAKLSDVFLVNKPPAVRDRLKITEADIREHNPNIVYAAGTAWGPKGPEGNRGGYDMTSFWFRSGAAMGTWVPGVPDAPGQPGPAFGDSMGAMTIAGGISAALLARERAGAPQSLEVSLLGTGMWAMGSGIAMSGVSGTAWRGMPSSGRNVFNPLVGTYRTADDRHLCFCCLQPFRYWAPICESIGRPELATDERFATYEALTTNAGDAWEILVEVFGSKTLADWREQLADFEGQWSPILDTLELFEDPQVAANEYIQDAVTADGIAFRLVTTPVQFNGEPSPVGHAPAFNEHGDEILTGDLGMDMDAVIDLKVKGAVT
jgi:crotonobetainyl-CoA:carnitine CoA-transferase CaiB-like acyl-CoA transferase